MLGDPLNWAKTSVQIRFPGCRVKEREKKNGPSCRATRLNEGNLSIQTAGLQREEGDGNWELKAGRRHGVGRSWKEAGEGEAKAKSNFHIRVQNRGFGHLLPAGTSLFSDVKFFFFFSLPPGNKLSK